jgi:hypothetical protein
MSNHQHGAAHRDLNASGAPAECAVLSHGKAARLRLLRLQSTPSDDLRSAGAALIRQLGHHVAANAVGVDAAILLDLAIGEPLPADQLAELERRLLAGAGS